LSRGIDMSARHQNGSVEFRNGRWTGRYKETVRLMNGATQEKHKRISWPIEEVSTEKQAERRVLAHILESEKTIKTDATLNEFLVRWLETMLPTYRLSTQKNLKRYLRIIVPLFGETKLQNIRPEGIQNFIGSFTKAHQAVNTISAFRTIWKRAMIWEYVSHDPFLGIVQPRLVKQERPCFTEDEVKKIISAAQEPWKTLYWLLAQTGLRISEALALSWNDIDFLGRRISITKSVFGREIQPTKTDAGVRSILISPALNLQLERYKNLDWRKNPQGLLFSTFNDTPYYSSTVLCAHLHPLLERLHIERAGFHAFRHASATLLDRMDAPMKIRQQRLGHQKAETTLGIYTHTNLEDQQKIAEKFDEVLCPA
jgi:integrase